MKKSELVETKASCKTKINELESKNHGKINELESELKQNHAKINELESELKQNHDKIKELESELQQSHAKVNELEYRVKHNHARMEDELQQNHALIEWTIQLNIRAIQLSSGNQVLPVIVRLSEYTAKKMCGVDWYSDPFYTHKEGYKVKLNVLPDGWNNGKGTHLSVYLYLVEGPYDDTLCWPLKGKFKVTLLNQVGNINHHSASHNVVSVNRIISFSNNTKEIWSHPRFIQTATLLNSNYLKNDSLFFEVSHSSF